MNTKPKATPPKPNCMPKLAHKPKGLLAAELLLRHIPQLYAPGEKLPPERLLAQELGVSRNTLREAIAALTLIGLLELRPFSGNFVREMPDPQQNSALLEDIFSSRTDLFTLLDARAAFEPGICRLAAANAEETDLALVEKCLETLVHALQREDSTAYSAADKEFHLAIARATHNSLIIQSLQPMIESLHTPLWGAMKSSIQAELLTRGRIEEHSRICAALQKRDAPEAEKAMYTHLCNSRQRLMGNESF